MTELYYWYPNPFPTEDSEPIDVQVNARLIPVIVRGIEAIKARRNWLTDSDWSMATEALSEVQRDLLMGSSELTEEVRKLYRLLNTSLNGEVYTMGPDGVVSPPTAAVPPVSTNKANALRAHVGRMLHLNENAHTGQEYAPGAGVEGSPGLPSALSWSSRLLALQGVTGGFLGIGETPVTLANLLQAGRVNTPADEGVINDAFEEVLGVISQGGNVGQVLSTLLGTASDVATDGGLMALQAAAVAATVAAATAQQSAYLRMVGELSNLNLFLSGTNAALGAPPLPAQEVLIGRKDPQSVPQKAGDLLLDIATATGVTRGLIGETTQDGRVIPLLTQILDELQEQDGGGLPGQQFPVVLNTDQYNAIVGLLACICTGVSDGGGEPTGPPQFNPNVCGPSWTLKATWRPQASGASLFANDGMWTIENPQGTFTSSFTAPDLYSVIVALPSGPHDCRVQVQTSDGLEASAVAATLQPYNLQDNNAGAGRPQTDIAGADVCTSFIAYEEGASGQDIGYGLVVASNDGSIITPDNFAAFVTFQSFG